MTAKTTQATEKKTQTVKAASYSEIQKQIAALQAQAAELQKQEYSKNKEYFSKIDFQKMELLDNDDIIGILSIIQKYYKFSDNRIIINEQGVFVKENKSQKDNKEPGNGKALFYVLDNAGNIAGSVAAQGPISEKFFTYMKDNIPAYKEVNWEGFRKGLKMDNSPSKEDYAKALCQANPNKFRMA